MNNTFKAGLMPSPPPYPYVVRFYMAYSTIILIRREERKTHENKKKKQDIRALSLCSDFAQHQCKQKPHHHHSVGMHTLSSSRNYLQKPIRHEKARTVSSSMIELNEKKEKCPWRTKKKEWERAVPGILSPLARSSILQLRRPSVLSHEKVFKRQNEKVMNC